MTIEKEYWFSILSKVRIKANHKNEAWQKVFNKYPNSSIVNNSVKLLVGIYDTKTGEELDE